MEIRKQLHISDYWSTSYPNLWELVKAVVREHESHNLLKTG